VVITHTGYDGSQIQTDIFIQRFNLKRTFST